MGRTPSGRSMTSLKTARAEWDAATRAWSRDDLTDITTTMKAGERMLFAGVDLICALEDRNAEPIHRRDGDEG